MGVPVKLLVEAQLSENRNYSEDTSNPKIWRPKGATWFQVEVDSDDLMYSETETILTEMVANWSDDLYKFEYLQHHEIFGGIQKLSSNEFARINERLHEEASMKKAIRDEEENLRETVNDMDPVHYSFYDLSPDDLAKLFGGNPNSNKLDDDIDPAGGYGLHSHE